MTDTTRAESLCQNGFFEIVNWIRNQMVIARTTAMLLIFWAIPSLLVFPIGSAAQPALPTVPGMGLYSNFADQICGKEGLKGARWNPEVLPWIGCFGLSSENSATGTISGHRFEAAVDSRGEEACKIDGAAVRCQGCIDMDRDCSTMMSVISHNADKSVFFYFAQKVGEHTYVTNQENWEDFQKHKPR